jgi:aerobic-type carbon monoxide dehydrogenase small subunit (CoxS/CutS family)
MRLALRINGATREVDAPPSASLLAVLRDDLGLTGTRFGCGTGQCGACFVIADGRAVASCLMPVRQAAEREITTVEGLARGDVLHPVQEAFIAEDAMQCGYCTSGMIVSATALLARDAAPPEAAIRDALAGNLCRCGVYGRAIRAVQRAAQTRGVAGGSAPAIRKVGSPPAINE